MRLVIISVFRKCKGYAFGNENLSPKSDPPTPAGYLKLRDKFEIPRGDLFFHFLRVGNVVLDLINDSHLLCVCDLTRLQPSKQMGQVISLLLVGQLG